MFIKHVLIQIIFSLNLIFKAFSKEQQKCFVLGMEGGGDKGSYQAGVFKALVDLLPAEKRSWDVVSGISAGSMNAFSVAIFPQGQEEAARDFMISNWLNISSSYDVYKSWDWGGLIKGLFFKTGLYDTSPLRKLLTSLVNNTTLEREYVMGSTNMETGKFENFDSEELDQDEYIDAIMASGAYPVVFPNIIFKNKTWMDGGVVVSVDLPTSVIKCRNLGFEDHNIVVDVLLNDAKDLKDQSVSKFHPFNVLFRVLEVMGYQNTMRDLDEMSRIYPNVTIRYVVAPSKKLPSGNVPLGFKPDQIRQMIDMGITDGTNAVKKGEGVEYQEMRRKYLEERVERVYGIKNVKDEDIEMYLNAQKGIYSKPPKPEKDEAKPSKNETKSLKFLN